MNGLVSAQKQPESSERAVGGLLSELCLQLLTSVVFRTLLTKVEVRLSSENSGTRRNLKLRLSLVAKAGTVFPQ